MLSVIVFTGDPFCHSTSAVAAAKGSGNDVIKRGRPKSFAIYSIEAREDIALNLSCTVLQSHYNQPTMRISSRLLANPSTLPASSTLRSTPLALLPPIPLYRRLFRAHRKHLPKEMRLLGDEYLKSEFRAHRNIENPMHIVSARHAFYSFSQQTHGSRSDS